MQTEQQTKIRELADILPDLLNSGQREWAKHGSVDFTVAPRYVAQLLKILITREDASFERFYSDRTRLEWCADRILGGCFYDIAHSVVVLGDKTNSPTRLFYQHAFNPKYRYRIEPQGLLPKEKYEYDTPVVVLKKVGDTIAYRPFNALADWELETITSSQKILSIAKHIGRGNYQELDPEQNQFEIRLEG